MKIQIHRLTLERKKDAVQRNATQLWRFKVVIVSVNFKTNALATFLIATVATVAVAASVFLFLLLLSIVFP